MLRMTRTLTCGIALIAGSLTSVSQAQVSEKQPPSGTSDSYEIYWSVTTQQNFRDQSGIDYAMEVDFDGAPVNTDFAILYQSRFGKFPKAGPHMLLLDDGLLNKHIRALADDMDRMVPNPDFDGIIAIDYETWRCIWDRTKNRPSNHDLDAYDQDFKNDWREVYADKFPDQIRGKSRSEREEIFRDSYEAQCRDFYLATLNEARRLRPNARFTFYGYPLKRYVHGRETPPGTFGYGNLTHRASQLNDRLQWMWDEVDVVSPSIYAIYKTVDNAQRYHHARGENTIAKDREYVMTNVAEAVRVANGKDVLPFTWVRYQGRGSHPHRRTFLNDHNLRTQLELPWRAGAAGVVIWEGIPSVDRYNELQSFMDSKMNREIKRVTKLANGR